MYLNKNREILWVGPPSGILKVKEPCSVKRFGSESLIVDFVRKK